jgi:hypothetical protein
MRKGICFWAGFVGLLFAGCSSTPFAPGTGFHEEQAANVIIRYYSNDTIYMLKPERTEGSFQSVLMRAEVLTLASQLPEHELAVVVIGKYTRTEDEDAVKSRWNLDLTQAGFRRIVFLQGGQAMVVKGLPILKSPTASLSANGS